MSYLISICKMFLEKEKVSLGKMKFRYNEIEMKFLKIYNEIVVKSRLSNNWFTSIKKEMLTIIMNAWKGEDNLGNMVSYKQSSMGVFGNKYDRSKSFDIADYNLTGGLLAN